jgi:hypothetical protein
MMKWSTVTMATGSIHPLVSRAQLAFLEEQRSPVERSDACEGCGAEGTSRRVDACTDHHQHAAAAAMDRLFASAGSSADMQDGIRQPVQPDIPSHRNGFC